jgi:cytochrome c oxidase cbb3-type subunit 3
MLRSRFALACVVLLWCCMLSTGVQAAPKGKLLYERNCAACHGSDGDGGVGVPLSLESFLSSVPDQYLQRTIRHGRPGRVMPAFPNLSDAQVDALVAYMRAWSDKPYVQPEKVTISGDAEHGKQIFASHCAQCHGESGTGGKGTGVTFSRKRDFPIIAPALNNPGFLASASDQMIYDTIVFGREGTPMTSMLVAGLSDQDIKDVVVYIRQLELQQEPLEPTNMDELEPAIIVDSPYGMQETIENLKQAIADQNFTLIRIESLDHGLVAPEQENEKRVMLHFCNFSMLFNSLALDPRVGMFLPCRVTVIERDGKVQLSTINPKRLSYLFNNHELDETCDLMYDLYVTVLEDATL